MGCQKEVLKMAECPDQSLPDRIGKLNSGKITETHPVFKTLVYNQKRLFL